MIHRSSAELGIEDLNSKRFKVLYDKWPNVKDIIPCKWCALLEHDDIAAQKLALDSHPKPTRATTDDHCLGTCTTLGKLNCGVGSLDGIFMVADQKHTSDNTVKVEKQWEQFLSYIHPTGHGPLSHYSQGHIGTWESKSCLRVCVKLWISRPTVAIHDTHIIFYKGHREIETMPVSYKKCTFMLCFWTRKC